MNKFNLNRAALFLVTPFLIGIFANRDFCQQPKIDFAAENYEIENLDSRNFKTAIGKSFFAAKTAQTANKRSSFPSRQTASNYTRPNADARFKKYLRRTFGGYALLGDLISSGFAQITDSPKEWENNGTGFARRLGSAFGKSVIEETAVYGLDETLKLDSNFYRSGKRKFGDRLGNAILTTFAARRANGKRVVGVPRIVGAYASNIIAAETWYPKNYDFKDGLRYGTISLGYDVLANVVKEFFLKK